MVVVRPLDSYQLRDVVSIKIDAEGGELIKVLWHDGIGMSLHAKRLERGRFIWPSPADGAVAISAAYCRNPVHTWRPQVAGWADLRYVTKDNEASQCPEDARHKVG
jgi:hypothetical protein